MKDITASDYDKLKYEASVNNMPDCKMKFVKRTRRIATLAIKLPNGNIQIISRSIYDVKVDGRELEYKDRFSFTNPKSPF